MTDFQVPFKPRALRGAQRLMVRNGIPPSTQRVGFVALLPARGEKVAEGRMRGLARAESRPLTRTPLRSVSPSPRCRGARDNTLQPLLAGPRAEPSVIRRFLRSGVGGVCAASHDTARSRSLFVETLLPAAAGSAIKVSTVRPAVHQLRMTALRSLRSPISRLQIHFLPAKGRSRIRPLRCACNVSAE